MNRVTFDVKYYNTSSGAPVFSHKHTETWSRDWDLFCPSCGRKSVWADEDPGDYYVGKNFGCEACGAIWTMPSLCLADPDRPLEADEQRIAGIRGQEE